MKRGHLVKRPLLKSSAPDLSSSNFHGQIQKHQWPCRLLVVTLSFSMATFVNSPTALVNWNSHRYVLHLLSSLPPPRMKRCHLVSDDPDLESDLNHRKEAQTSRGAIAGTEETVCDSSIEIRVRARTTSIRADKGTKLKAQHTINEESPSRRASK
ncbi:hypothetical protein F2Q68_00016276 [Brassica cretica]|uniref:Uncharacterized protein n=1 Tax=Brassica cretica TaxID=69181 RepID=A0A8S9HJG0_BRACR|nr:hypothetical protein F2Q68_00016276 [Brassica cretica]